MARGCHRRVLLCRACRMARKHTEVVSVSAWYFDPGCA